VPEDESKRKLQEIEAVKIGLGLLCDLVFGLRERVTPKKPEWGSTSDARRMAFGNLYRPCLTNPVLLFNLINNLGKEPRLDTFAKLTGLEQEINNRENALWDIVLFVLTNTILMFQFQVENLFQNLWRELGEQEERSFIKLSEKLLTKLGFSDVAEKMKRIKTLAYIRNSLHNNGVHNGPDYNFGINTTLTKGDTNVNVDASFAFVRDRPVTCCGPMHILGLSAGIIEIVKDVIESEKIRTIPGPIRDRFAWSEKD